jgi:hypothetical protein
MRLVQRVQHLVWLQLAQVLRPLLVKQVRQALLRRMDLDQHRRA